MSLPANPDADAAADPLARADLIPVVARALLGLIEERGRSPDRLCRGLGFAYRDLMRHDVLVSYQQTRALILRAQRLLGEPAIGLAVGARQTPVSWGLAGLAMLTCETFGEAIGYGIAHQSAAGAMVDHLIEVQGREVHLELLPRRFDLEIEPYLIEEAFASAIAIGRYLAGPAFKPLRVNLGFPADERQALYRRFFHCPVGFDTGAHRLTIDARWIDTRLPGYDRIACGLVREQLDALLSVPRGRHDLVETLANRLRFSVEQPASMGALAQLVNVSDRTLRRRLQRQSVGYRDLLDETRYERARDLLAHSAMTVAQVAEAVGYSDARAFRRAFKRWSGQLPSAFRGGAAS